MKCNVIDLVKDYTWTKTNPICCNVLWALNYFVRAIRDPQLETWLCLMMS